MIARTVGRHIGYGLGAAAAAVLAMTAVAAAGVALLGGGGYGDAGALTAAVVVLAAGGHADLSLGGAGGMPALIDGYGTIALRPLGVSLAGAVAFGAVLRWPSRRGTAHPRGTGAARWRPGAPATKAPRPVVETGPGPAVRAGSAALGFCALVWVVSRLGRGELTVPAIDGQGERELVVGFGTSPVRAAVGALAWVIVVLALCWLGSSRAPAPAAWRRWREPLRRALLAGFTVAAAGVALVVAGAALGGAGSAAGPALLGGALLFAPTVLVALVTVGIGARWTVELGGPLGEQLGARLAGLSEQPALSVGRLAAESDGPGWLGPPAFAVVVLLSFGVLAAWPGGGARPLRLRTASGWAGLLGAVLGSGLPGLAALARIGLDAGVSAFGNKFTLVEAELHTSLPVVAACGLAGGAAAGFLGSLAAYPLARCRGTIAVRRASPARSRAGGRTGRAGRPERNQEYRGGTARMLESDD